MKGTLADPYTVAPEDWHENGVPYGAFCKCHQCGYIGRSTIAFDYHAGEPRNPLVCDQCLGASTYATERALRDRVEPEIPDHK